MRRRRKRLLTGGSILVLLIVAAGVGAYLHQKGRTGNIYNPHAPFIPQTAPTPAPRPVATDKFTWPFYGYTLNHTRFYPAPTTMRPPFKQVWMHHGSALLEFPPVISRGRLFQLADSGIISAIDKNTGRNDWSRRLGALSASTPAVGDGLIFATILDREPGLEEGRVVALKPSTGRIVWSKDLPSQSESSPIYDQGRIFFGSQDGTVYALDASTGHTVWTYHAAGSVKASPTLANGVLYFGDYSGHIQAISERTGHVIWDTESGGELIGSGNFYSTAAVMYGRVFLGNTDGHIYAYSAANGSLDWAIQTGAYVYASPAVTNAPALGPTVYIGSYNGDFYAINARSGHIDWTYDAGGKISGSATIIGRIVYFADIGTYSTTGLGISTGKVYFHANTGSFDPVISDGHYLYLTGYSDLAALLPTDTVSSGDPAASAPTHGSHATVATKHRAAGDGHTAKRRPAHG